MSINSLNLEERQEAINALRSHFERFQYRQELHDRFYHKDIYVLPKAHRLTHLVLHHAKYIPQLYDLKRIDLECGLISAHRDNLRRILIDGIIVSFSMLNVLEKSFISLCLSNILPYQTLDKDAHLTVGKLLTHLGNMAKAVEDIDHLGHGDIPQTLGDIAKEMIKCYAGLLIGQSDSWYWERILQTCEERLLHQELKNLFHKRHHRQINHLMSLKNT